MTAPLVVPGPDGAPRPVPPVWATVKPAHAGFEEVSLSIGARGLILDTSQAGARTTWASLAGVFAVAAVALFAVFARNAMSWSAALAGAVAVAIPIALGAWRATRAGGVAGATRTGIPWADVEAVTAEEGAVRVRFRSEATGASCTVRGSWEGHPVGNVAVARAVARLAGLGDGVETTGR